MISKELSICFKIIMELFIPTLFLYMYILQLNTLWFGDIRISKIFQNLADNEPHKNLNKSSMLYMNKLSFFFTPFKNHRIISSPVVCLCHGFMSVVDRAP